MPRAHGSGDATRARERRAWAARPQAQRGPTLEGGHGREGCVLGGATQQAVAQDGHIVRGHGRGQHACARGMAVLVCEGWGRTEAAGQAVAQGGH